MTKLKLVMYDNKTKYYHAYEGRECINTIASDVPLSKEFVERFRTKTKEVMREIDGEEDEGPNTA